MEDKKGRSDTDSIFDLFPYMQSFPFNEYEFDLKILEKSNSDSGINPIIIEEAGKYVSPSTINFYTSGELTNISISFYTYDIKFIEKRSTSIKKMDQINKALDTALNSYDFLDKLIGINIGEKFLKKIGSGLSASSIFNRILDELIIISEIKMQPDQLKLIKKFDNSIKQEEFDDAQQQLIREYYNLYLHHARILLGIVIAIKIH